MEQLTARHMSTRDGNEATASVAQRLNEAMAIYPMENQTCPFRLRGGR